MTTRALILKTPSLRSHTADGPLGAAGQHIEIATTGTPTNVHSLAISALVEFSIDFSGRALTTLDHFLARCWNDVVTVCDSR